MHFPANVLNKRDLGLEAEVLSFSKKQVKNRGCSSAGRSMVSLETAYTIK